MPNTILPESEWQTEYAPAHQRVSSLNVGFPKEKKTNNNKADVTLKSLV